ncbi:MAG: hypothetical protein K0S86_4715, partial [Geminicoccaceae bacterium]|nr:hypothetical protein [Geminicoccaceae bacterium]
VRVAVTVTCRSEVTLRDESARAVSRRTSESRGICARPSPAARREARAPVTARAARGGEQIRVMHDAAGLLRKCARHRVDTPEFIAGSAKNRISIARRRRFRAGLEAAEHPQRVGATTLRGPGKRRHSARYGGRRPYIYGPVVHRGQSLARVAHAEMRLLIGSRFAGAGLPDSAFSDVFTNAVPRRPVSGVGRTCPAQ